jgi:hypothetical protein
MHLIRLMTSWAVVCDVYYLEPQTRREGETVIEFAERVQTLICDRINIKKVPWDGYLKYYRPSPKLTEKRQQKFAESILKRLDAPLTPTGRAFLLWKIPWRGLELEKNPGLDCSEHLMEG